jgi:hypothetical protein
MFQFLEHFYSSDIPPQFASLKMRGGGRRRTSPPPHPLSVSDPFSSDTLTLACREYPDQNIEDRRCLKAGDGQVSYMLQNSSAG